MSGAVLRGGFEKLAHLVDEQDQPAVRLGLRCGRLHQGGDQIALGPAAARHARYKSSPFDGFSDDADGIVAPSDDGNNAPSLRACRQRVPDLFRQLLSEDLGRVFLQSRIAVQQGAQRNHKA